MNILVTIFWVVTKWKQQVPPRHWEPTTSLHGVTTQKTTT